MSSSSSRTTNDVVEAAKLSPELFLAYFIAYGGTKTAIQEQQAELKQIQADLAPLDAAGIPILRDMNRLPERVEKVKAVVEPLIMRLNYEFRFAIKTTQTQTFFEAYVAEQKGEPIAAELAKKFDEHFSKKSLNLLKFKPQDLLRIDRATLAIGNAALAVSREAILDAADLPRKLNAARQVYKAFIAEYLRSKISNFEVDKRPAAFYDTIVSHMTDSLYQRAQDGSSAFIAGLIEANNAKKDKQGRSIFTSTELDELKVLEKTLMASYAYLSEFESTMTRLAHRLSSAQNIASSLGAHLPDIHKFRTNDPLPFEWSSGASEDKKNYFMGASAEDRVKRDALLRDYVKSVDTRVSPKELPPAYEAIGYTIVQTILNNYSDAILHSFDDQFSFAGVDPEITQAIKHLFVFIRDRHKQEAAPLLMSPSNEQKKSLPENSIVPAQTITHCIARLHEVVGRIGNNKYVPMSLRNDANEKLKAITESKEDQLGLPAELKPYISSELNIEQFERQVQQYEKLVEQQNRITTFLAGLNERVPTDLDVPLLELLRAQVLHAAKIHFYPEKSPNTVAHLLHHGTGGDERMVKFVQAIMSRQVRTFADAVKIIQATLADKKMSSGHTSSLDSLLSFVLYNEGKPRGLFKESMVTIREQHQNLLARYPQYKPAAIRKYTDVEGMKSFLKLYELPGLSLSGTVTRAVRGDKRADKEIRAELSQMLVTNLGTIANYVEQVKAGKEIEYKVEVAAPRSINRGPSQK
jgi:hypothetical protein